MSWMLSIWAATALLAFCRGQTTEQEGSSLSASGYHLCVHNETRTVSFLVMHTVSYTGTKPCDSWLHLKTCPVTLYKMNLQTEYKTVTEQVTRCCSGYVPVGRYCAQPVNRSVEFTAKPGSCPTEDGLCPSSGDCEGDMDCPGWKKCCQRSGHLVCSDPASSANSSENGGCRLNVTVTVKTDYQQLMSSDGGHLDHIRLLQAMVTGALQADVSVHHLGSQPVHPYRTATSLLIVGSCPLSLHNVTSKLHLLLKHIQEVSHVSVEDVDECSQPALRRCSPQAHCNNTEGSYRCTCHQGYTDVDPSNPGAHCTVSSSTPRPPGPSSSTETSMTAALRNTSQLHYNSSFTSSAPHSSMISTVETPRLTTTCSPPSIINVWTANVTGTSFCVYWSSQFHTNQTYQVVVRKRSEVVLSRGTSQTMMEVRHLKPGVLYTVTVTPSSCGGQGVALNVSVKTDAQTLDATTRLTNVQFTADLQNISSDAYRSLTESIKREIYQSLSPEMKAKMDSDQVRIEFRGISEGSVVVNFSIIMAPSQRDIRNVSKDVLNSLMNSTEYAVDGNNTSTSDFNECDSGEHDCSQRANCTNTWGSYTCVCQDGFTDNNPERPGRACREITTTPAPTIPTTTPVITSPAPTTTTTAPVTTSTSPTTTTAPVITSTAPTTTTTAPTTNITALAIATTATTTNTTARPTTTTAPITTTVPTTTTIAPTTTTTALTTTTTAPITTTTAPTTTTTAPTTILTAPAIASTAPTTTTTTPTTTSTIPTITAPTASTAAPTIAATAPTTNITAPAITSTSPTTTTAPTNTTTAPTTTSTAPTTTITVPTTSTAAPTTTTTAPTTNITAPAITSTAPTTTTTAFVTSTTALTTTTTTPTTPTTTSTVPTTTAPTTSTAAPTTTTTAPTTNITAPAITSTAPTTTTTAFVTSTIALTTTTTTPTTPTTTSTVPTTTAPTTSTAAPTINTTAPTTDITAPAITSTAPTTTNNTVPTTTAPITSTTALTITTTTPATTSTAPTTTAPTTTSTVPTTTAPTTSTAAPAASTSPPTTTTVMASTTSTPTTTVTALTTTAPASRTAPNASMLGAISVECRAGAITVTVAKAFLLNNNIQESAVYLGSPECVVNGGNATHVQLTVAWNECDTNLLKNETYYTASVTLLSTMETDTSAPSGRLEAPIMCTYKKDMVISADFGSVGYDIFKDFIVGSGFFQVTVQLMNGTVPLPHNYSMSSEEAVVVEVSLNTSSEQIKVIIHKCWATPTQNPVDVNSHTFLDNSCSLNTFTKVLMNGNSSTSRLSVQIFSFVDLDVIYLHCQVQICAQIGSDTCVPDCLQRTARSSNILATAVGSTSAVLKSDDDFFEEGFTTLHIVGLACLGVGLSLIFIIGFTCLFYYQRNRIGHYNFSPKPKQENFTYLVFNA